VKKKLILKLSKQDEGDIYRIGYTGEATSASPKSTLSSSGLIFIGAKEVDIIQILEDLSYPNNFVLYQLLLLQ
jgi:hypothetical protein